MLRYSRSQVAGLLQSDTICPCQNIQENTQVGGLIFNFQNIFDSACDEIRLKIQSIILNLFARLLADFSTQQFIEYLNSTRQILNLCSVQFISATSVNLSLSHGNPSCINEWISVFPNNGTRHSCFHSASKYI